MTSMSTNKENEFNSQLEDVRENIDNLWQQMKDNQRLASRPIFEAEQEEKKLKELMYQTSDWREKIKLAAKIISLKL